MRTLSKSLLGIFLLTFTAVSWAACPEGYKNNYKGECVPVASSKVAGGSNVLYSGSGWRFKRSLPVGAKKHGYQVVSAPEYPVRYGKKSERFEVRPGDCSRGVPKNSWDDCKNDRERSELLQDDWPQIGYRQREGDEYWYRWSIYIPEGHQNIYRTKLAYGQFHEWDGCPPTFMFQEYGGGYWFNIQPPIKGYDDNRKLLEANEFIGKWNDIVVHARWTKKNDGWFKVWVNGQATSAYQGKTMVCSKDVYFKYGVYRSFLSRNSNSKTVTTIAYYDGVVRSKSKEGMFDPLSE